MERKLNLGCGPDHREDYLNVDLIGLCDKVIDLRGENWYLPENHFEEILALDIIEHIPDTLQFMNNCHLVAKIGCKLFIRTPSYDAKFAWSDPTHVKVFTLDTFDFFDPTTDYGKYNIHLTNKKWKVTKKIKTKNKNLEIELEKI